MKSFQLKDLLVILCSVISSFIVSMIVINVKDEEVLISDNNQVIIQEATIANQLDIEEETLVDMINRIKNSVVDITSSSLNASSAGSGVIIGSDDRFSYIITNHHVIDGGNSFSVDLYTGSSYEALLVGSDPENDIAVIKIEKTGLTEAVFVSDSDKLRVGDVAIAIGNPLGTLGGTVSKGIISALDRELSVNGETLLLMQTDAAVNSGNSGGGLFNEDGLLIGIVNAKAQATGVEGLAFAIPANVAKEISTELISTATNTEYGYIRGRTTVGAQFVNGYISDGWFSRQEIVYIYHLEQESSAYISGLRVEDIILSITIDKETYEIDSADQISDIIKRSEIGDELLFTIKRGTTTKDIKVTVEQYIYNLNYSS